MSEAPAFADWFGRSKVVDAAGQPRSCWHGTNAHAYSEGGIESFNTRPPSGRGAAFFTSDRRLASQYGERVYEAFLSLQNPLIVYGDGKSWTALCEATRVEGDVTELLRAASHKQAVELNEIFVELSEMLGEESPPLAPKFSKDTASLEGRLLGDLPGLSGEGLETDAVVKAARRLGFDGVIFKDIQDSPTWDAGYARTISDIYAVFDPKQIRHAAAVRQERELSSAASAQQYLADLPAAKQAAAAP